MIKICEWCKKEFETEIRWKLYCCEQCKKQGKRKNRNVREKRYKERRKVEKTEKIQKKTNEITDIAVAARAVGMIYGEYVARVLNADKYKVYRKEFKDGNK